MPADAMEAYIGNIIATAPLGREGTVAEIANAALFPGSDDSAYMTAANLVVDGGWMNVEPDRRAGAAVARRRNQPEDCCCPG